LLENAIWDGLLAVRVTPLPNTGRVNRAAQTLAVAFIDVVLVR
jgi:hypothetical protein